jgi:hypothetical protein
VALLRDDSFYVSDGYCNGRLVRYSAAGEELAAVDIPGMRVSHSVLVDECADLVYVANREAGKVHKVAISSGQQQAEVDVSEQGRAWALLAGPYGQALVLAWELGKPASLVDLADPRRTWLLPGLEQGYPHDVALGAAALGLSGPGERFFAVYVAPTCPGCKSLQKFVLLPGGFQAPSREDMLRDAAPAAAAAGNASSGGMEGQHAAAGSPSPKHSPAPKAKNGTAGPKAPAPKAKAPAPKAKAPAPQAKAGANSTKAGANSTKAAAASTKAAPSPSPSPGVSEGGSGGQHNHGAVPGAGQPAAAAPAKQPAPAAEQPAAAAKQPAAAAEQPAAAAQPQAAKAQQQAAAVMTPRAGGANDEYGTMVMEPVEEGATASVAGFVVVLILVVITLTAVASGYYYVQHLKRPAGPRYVALSSTAALPVSTSPRTIR